MNLFPQFLSQNNLRRIWQMIEVRHLLRCPGCLLARLSQTFAKCMIKKRSDFRTIKRMEPAISAFIFQPPYPLYHFILVIDSLCRSLHIAIYYNPIYLGKCAYPFTGKSLCHNKAKAQWSLFTYTNIYVHCWTCIQFECTWTNSTHKTP